MGLFQYEQICSLNESEFSVYHYVLSHLPEIEAMSIRELSSAVGVSTTTILRFCGKLGCSGYTEFKYKIQQLSDRKSREGYFASVSLILQFLKNTENNPELDRQLEEAARLCIKAPQVLFFGVGTNGGLGEFGSHLFCYAGVAAFSIKDPFYPPPGKDMEDSVLFVLSVSGETPSVISLVDQVKKKGMKVVSITNISQCTIARLSEINFSYFMPLTYAYQEDDQRNLTTQVPVVYLLELLSRKIHLFRMEEGKED